MQTSIILLLIDKSIELYFFSTILSLNLLIGLKIESYKELLFDTKKHQSKDQNFDMKIKSQSYIIDSIKLWYLTTILMIIFIRWVILIVILISL